MAGSILSQGSMAAMSTKPNIRSSTGSREAAGDVKSMIMTFVVGALAGSALACYYVESEFREFSSALIPRLLIQ